MSTADGGTQGDPEGDAQSQASLLGKILRIDVGVPPSAVDTVGPTLRTVAKSRQRLLRLRGAVAYVRCSENCSLVVGGRLHVGKRTYRLRRVKTLGPANKRVRMKLPLGSKARRTIVQGVRRHRRIRIDVTLRARDALGNRSKLTTRVVRLKR